MEAKRVSLFRNGRNQAVRIPREFELPGKEALMRYDNGRLIVEPVAVDGLLALLDRLEPIAEEWPEIDDPLPEPVSL